MQLKYPERLKLANTPTPIQPLDRLSERLGCRLWIKRDDLTGSATSGNKIRKLEFTLARAKQQGADTIITCGGVQSNHCRATAILGAQLGFKVHLLLRGEEPQEHQGNLMLDQVAGASISYFSPRYYNSRFDFILSEVVSDYKSSGMKPYFITTGASDATGVWGYVSAAEEIANQREVSFDHIVTATGSGGTQAGLTVGSSIYMPETRVIGMAVCDDEAYFRKKVLADLDAWSEFYKQPVDIDHLSVNVCDRYIGPGYAKAGREIFKCIELVARSEGIVLDPVYTGKAFFGMLAEIESGNLVGDNILFVHTGGIFGLLAQPVEYQQNRQQ
ncbi:MAG: D-cysteine desulfhydrase family protein [Porticoccaceae bacterium]